MNLKQEADQFLEERYGMSDFNSYQRSAVTTAIYPNQHKIIYPALGMAGEAGEVANKVKKLIRDGPDKRPDTWREDSGTELCTCLRLLRSPPWAIAVLHGFILSHSHESLPHSVL